MLEDLGSADVELKLLSSPHWPLQDCGTDNLTASARGVQSVVAFIQLSRCCTHTPSTASREDRIAIQSVSAVSRHEMLPLLGTSYNYESSQMVELNILFGSSYTYREI